jgi:hypothetical protein
LRAEDGVVFIVVHGTPAASTPAFLERLDLAVNEDGGLQILGVRDRFLEPVVFEPSRGHVTGCTRKGTYGRPAGDCSSDLASKRASYK